MRRGIYEEIKRERARAKETKSERAVEGKKGKRKSGRAEARSENKRRATSNRRPEARRKLFFNLVIRPAAKAATIHVYIIYMVIYYMYA